MTFSKLDTIFNMHYIYSPPSVGYINVCLLTTYIGIIFNQSKIRCGFGSFAVPDIWIAINVTRNNSLHISFEFFLVTEQNGKRYWLLKSSKMKNQTDLILFEKKNNVNYHRLTSVCISMQTHLFIKSKIIHIS